MEIPRVGAFVMFGGLSGFTGFAGGAPPAREPVKAYGSPESP